MLFQKEERIKTLIISICSFVMIFLGVICAFSVFKLKEESRLLPDDLKKNTNILVILLDDNKKNSDLFLAVSVNSKNKEISVTEILPSEKVFYDGAEQSLGEVYSEIGEQAARACVEKLIGFKADKYICPDKDFVSGVINVTGNISFELEKEFSFEKNGEKFEFKKGLNEVYPIQFAEGISYASDKQGLKNERQKMTTAFFEVLSNLKIENWQEKEIVEYVKNAKTDIASYEAEEYIKIFSSMDGVKITVK